MVYGSATVIINQAIEDGVLRAGESAGLLLHHYGSL
jgi:hypothetical protein